MPDSIVHTQLQAAKPDESSIQLALLVNSACTNMAKRSLFRTEGHHAPHADAWAEAALTAATIYNKPHLLWPVTLLLQTSPEQAYVWARKVIEESLA